MHAEDSSDYKEMPAVIHVVVGNTREKYHSLASR